MKILVLNCGSSSAKYQLFDMTDESVLAKGLVERIGMSDAILTHRPTGKDQFRTVQPIFEHTAAIQVISNALIHPKHGVIRRIEDIEAVGHRVVHGGEKFTAATLVDADVKEAITEFFDLAPLHNPAHLKGILAVEGTLPNVPQVTVFDTAFHATIPRYAYLYALPYDLYQRYKVRRYGFHGTSHKFVAHRAAALMQKDIASLKIITCHLGNGASITAIDGGKSVETSMGLTPLEGLIMGTRCGDIDPAIIPFLMGKEDLTIREVDAMLNKHSGLVGITGMSSDMRDIVNAADGGDDRAKLAIDMYIHRIRKYIGAYTVAMNGLDVLIFTAGVGENNPFLWERICQNLTCLGAAIDITRYTVKGEEREISTSESSISVWVIPTNEELMIARDTMDVIRSA